MSSPDSTDLHAAKSLEDLRSAIKSLELTAIEGEPISLWSHSTRASPRTVDLVERLVARGHCKTIGDLVSKEEFHRKLYQTGGRRAEKNLVEDLQEWLTTALASPTEEPGGDDGAETGSVILRVGMSEEELGTWAAGHRVERWLGQPVRVLGDLLARRTDTWLWQHDAEGYTVERILCAPTAASAYWPRRGTVPRAVQDAVIQLLLDKAGVIQGGLDEEEERLRSLDRPHGNPSLLDLWERLLDARAFLTSQAPPLPNPARGLSSLHFQISPPRVIYIEEDSAWCDSRGESTVEINPKAQGPEDMLRCSCESLGAARCSLEISALDALLSQMADLSEGSLSSQLADILDRPHWSRALEDFDQVLQSTLPTSGAAARDYEIGWRLRHGEEQRFTLEPVEVRPRRSGEGVKARKGDLMALRTQPGLGSLPVDRRVAELLLPDPDNPPRSHRGMCDTETVHRALDLLVGHPRVLFCAKSNDRLITVRRAELSLHWNKLEDGSITIQSTIDNQPMDAEELAAAAREGVSGGCLVELDADNGHCTVTPIQPGVVGLLGVLDRRGHTFAVDAGSELLGRLQAFSRMLPVLLSETLRGMEMDADSRPLVRLEVLGDGDLQIQVRVEPLAGVEAWFPGRGPRELYGEAITGRIFCRRDFAVEEAQAQALISHLPPPETHDPSMYDRVLRDPMAALDFVEYLQTCGTEVKVAWPEFGRRYVSRARGASNLTLKITGMKHWLGITGSLAVEGLEVGAEDLFEALLQGRRFVKVADSGWIRLEDELIEQLDSLSRCISRRKEGLTLSNLQSLELLRLEELGVGLEAPHQWRQLTANIRSSADLDIDLPAGLDAELRGYQEDGYRWLSRLAHWSPGACLADDMGLGKTVQALALLSERSPVGPALVVAPTSVGFNWLREAARFTPKLRARMYRGAKRSQLLEDLRDGDILITSYSLVARDEETLKEIEFATLILDEAQAIKNPDTRRARAVHNLQAKFRIALTGTPIENRISELWSIFAAVTPGLLGRRDEFRSRFITPMEKRGATGDAARKALARTNRPFILRRTKEEVAPELPPRTSVILRVVLSSAEKKLYNEMRSAAVAGMRSQIDSSDGDVRRFQVLAALTRLRQLACHPRLVDPASELSSSKLELLCALLEELRGQGHRALVFSQFTTHLELAREALDAMDFTYRYLDGSLSEPRRRMEVDAFQSGEGDAFLISLRAGGTGLNLTGASYVIHLDPWWNPAVEDQAADRAHRIGQKDPVTIYRLVAQDTIEEAIISLQEEKRTLVAEMLEGTDRSAHMSVDDLLELLSAQPPLVLEEENDEQDLMDEAKPLR
jgi:hypothetical protein